MRTQGNIIMKKKQTLLTIFKNRSKKDLKSMYPVSFGHPRFEDFDLALPSEQEGKDTLPDCRQDEKGK